MLKRVITAVILIPIVIVGIFYMSTAAFSLAVALLLSLAAWEWAALAKIDKLWQRILYIGLLWWGFAASQLLAIKVVLGVNLVWWLLAIYLAKRFSTTPKKLFTGWRSCAISFLVFVPCLAAFDRLHRLSALYVLLVLCLVWAADSGAYFVGSYFGKHKLAPQISPGKTLEGVAGGILAAVVVAIVFAVVAKVGLHDWLFGAVIVIVTILAAVLGDLFESMVKRQAGVKDSGYWVPGHGGVLDRIDSLTAAVPMFTLGLLLFIR
ncbi:MAG: phosphatidate cytidylyltransferase [Gammaproteobacteria bacterium]|nr:phosphatidate cytidylyltransferase [Gammaproteobacteria bacterium]